MTHDSKTLQNPFQNPFPTEAQEMGCEYRVGRTKRGEVRLEIREPVKGTWLGFIMSDEDARGLAGALCKETRTAAEMTADKSLEP